MAALTLQVSQGPRLGPVVAPQLVAQSALLELDFAELESRIQQELAENPALETEDRNKATLHALPFERPAAPTHERLPCLEETLRAPHTLQDDLRWQFAASAPSELYEVGHRLIAAVDDTGYLRADIFDVACEMGCSLEHVQAAVEWLQRLEPAGVGARSLQECLLLQVRRRRELGEPCAEGVEEVIGACGGALAADLIAQIAQRTGFRRSQVEAALRFIREQLYPFPGSSGGGQTEAGAGDPPGYIYPDVIIRRHGECLSVETPVSSRRYLRLSRAYLELERAYRELHGREGTEGEQRAREQLQKAREFIGMLQRREETIRRITQTVVAYQEQFILRGPMYHRPLSKKQVAEQTGLHEAVVCRATRGKHVMMPSHEVVSFDVFFEPAVPVKRVIAQLVRNESESRPLSDQQIVTALSKQGYEIARRTVAKYRGVLGIPGSAQRKRRMALTRARP